MSADPALMVGGMALGHLLPQAAPRWLLYLIATATVAYLFRRQLRKFLR